jgi:hypothetical protein
MLFGSVKLHWRQLDEHYRSVGTVEIRFLAYHFAYCGSAKNEVLAFALRAFANCKPTFLQKAITTSNALSRWSSYRLNGQDPSGVGVRHRLNNRFFR